MTKSSAATKPEWVDPDDAPEWTDEMFDIAQFSIGGKVIRPATGYLDPNGVVRGRPPQRGVAEGCGVGVSFCGLSRLSPSPRQSEDYIPSTVSHLQRTTGCARCNR